MCVIFAGRCAFGWMCIIVDCNVCSWKKSVWLAGVFISSWHSVSCGLDVHYSICSKLDCVSLAGLCLVGKNVCCWQECSFLIEVCAMERSVLL